MLRFVLFLLAASAVSTASAATYYVRTDGDNSNTGTAPGPSEAWATIYHASRQSLAPGDIVYVKAGTYNEQINPTIDGASGSPIRFIADVNGTVSGWDPGTVTVQAPTGQRALYLVSDEYLEFYDFRFLGSTTLATYFHTSDGTRLERCEIIGSGHSGIYCYNSDATLVNVLIHDCFYYGIYTWGDSNLTAWHCTIANIGYDGLRAHGTSVVTLTNSIVAFNGRYGLWDHGGTINHSYNLVYGNATADYRDTTQGTGEINSEPYFASLNDYRLQAISPAIDAGTNAAGTADEDITGLARPQNGLWDMGCYERDPNLETYYVRPDGDDSNSGTGSTAAEAWATLTHAATASLNPGDVVYVHPGTYTGFIQPSVDGTSDNPIRFMAVKYGSVTDWPKGDVTVTVSSGTLLNTWGDDYLEFYNFHFVGANASGLYFTNGTGCRVVGCDISGCANAVWATAGGDVTVVNCVIHDNTQNSFVASGMLTVWNCTVVNNAVGTGYNAVFVNGGAAMVTNCIFANNGDGLSVSSGKLDNSYNIVFGHGNNYEGGASAGTGEITNDPLFVGPSDFRLSQTSPAIDAGTSAAGIADDDFNGASRPRGATWDMGAYETADFYYVRPDGSDTNTGTGPTASEAWATINHAATQALQPGDVVTVMAGTYNEQINPTIDGQLGVPIRFIGDKYGVTDGWAAGEVRVEASTSARALFINRDDYLEFYDFHFVGSNSQAVLLYPGEGIRLENCELTGSGTGLYCYNCESTLVNLLIHDFPSLAFYNYGSSVTQMWNCTIANNVNNHGVRTHQTSELTLRNCIIANNRYGIVRYSGTIDHSHNLFFNNSIQDYYGTTAGVGEFNADPLFVCDGSFYPDEDSPAIDAGTDGSTFLSNDLDANDRPLGAGWDIGCYEGSGLIAHWKLDETSGDTAVDSSGHGRDGTYTYGPTLGAQSNTSELGTAVTFDGVNDYVEVPPVQADFSRGISISFWARPHAAPPSYFAFVGLSNGQAVDDIWLGWVASAGLELYLTDTVDGSGTRIIKDDQLFVLNKWVHCVATVDAAGNAVLYRNGEITEDGVNTSLPTNVLRSQNFVASSVWNDEFPGDLDDVRIYNRPMCADEVAGQYEKGRKKGVRIISWVEVK